MTTLADPMDNRDHHRSPRFAIGALVIPSVLCAMLALLRRAAENTKKRATSGEARYPALFDHAVAGIFALAQCRDSAKVA